MDRLWLSDDWGQSWLPFSGGLPEGGIIHAVNLDYAQPDALYVSAEQGLFRWTGTAWKKLYDHEVFMAAITYQRSEQIWAVSRTEGIKRYAQVIHSENSGRTWSDGNLTGYGNMTLALDPSSSNRRYALWEYPAGMFDLWRWTEGGWLQLAPPKGFKLPDSYYPKMLDAQGWALDGATGDLYIACDDREICGYAHQIWRSRNPAEDNPVNVKWELLSDFGLSYKIRLLAAGPTPQGQGLALYAAFQEYSPDYCGPLGAELPAVSYDGDDWTYLSVPLTD